MHLEARRSPEPDRRLEGSIPRRFERRRLESAEPLVAPRPAMDDRAKLAAVEAQLEALLAEYGGLLRATVARLCPSELRLHFDDIEQEARLRLWRALLAAREIAHPASYLYRAAASATVDAIRRAAARRDAALGADEGADVTQRGDREGEWMSPPRLGPDRVAERRLLLRRAWSALASMAPERRRAVGLHLRGFTPREIGELLGWSESKARSLVYRGLEELRRRLADEEEEHGAGRRPEAAV